MSYADEREYYGVHKAVLLVVYLRANPGKEITRAQAKQVIGGDKDALRRAIEAIEHVFGNQVQYDRYRIWYNPYPYPYRGDQGDQADPYRADPYRADAANPED
jgi:hypothetical protein